MDSTLAVAKAALCLPLWLYLEMQPWEVLWCYWCYHEFYSGTGDATLSGALDVLERLLLIPHYPLLRQPLYTTLGVTGAATMDSTLSVAKATTCLPLGVTGDATMGGTLGVTSNATRSTLGVTGATTLFPLWCVGAATVGEL